MKGLNKRPINVIVIPAISSLCRGRALGGWRMEEDAVLKLHSR